MDLSEIVAMKSSQAKRYREAIDKSFANMSGARTLFKYPKCVPDYTNERDYSDTQPVHVYVVLPPGIINIECDLVDGPDDELLSQLKTLKSINVDGVSVDIWWGIVEANNPQKYKWRGYKQLFRMLLSLGLKIQVIMSFHDFRGDEVQIPLPKWIKEIGKENDDIYFTDIHGKRNLECLTWGIDDEPVLRGRTSLQVYTDFMSSFRSKFDEFLKNESITNIQIGLGPCGELRFPLCPEYSGIGKFQCYDKYLKGCPEKASKENGVSSWGKPPDNAGDSCSSQPRETRDFVDYSSKYDGFLQKWCSKYLIDHADKVLSKAISVFKDQPSSLSVKVSGLQWWVKPDSRADAELKAGFVDGYAPLISSVLGKHDAGLNFTFGELSTLGLQEIFHPEMLVSKIMKCAWDNRVEVVGENAYPCYDREGYDKISELAKPRRVCHKYKRFDAFTYNRLNKALLEQNNLKEFQQFVKRMHGEKAALENWIKFDS